MQTNSPWSEPTGPFLKAGLVPAVGTSANSKRVLAESGNRDVRVMVCLSALQSFWAQGQSLEFKLPSP
jgi:hypothetical protein